MVMACTVNDAPLPEGPISGNASWCFGSVYIPETAYSVAHVFNATSYVWSIPYGTIIISGFGTNGIVTNAPPGMGLFSVYVTNQYGIGVPSYLYVNVLPYQSVNFRSCQCVSIQCWLNLYNGIG